MLFLALESSLLEALDSGLAMLDWNWPSGSREGFPRGCQSIFTYSLLIYPLIKRRITSLEPYAACQVWLKFTQWFGKVVNVFVHYYRKRLSRLDQASVTRIIGGTNRLEGPSHFEPVWKNFTSNQSFYIYKEETTKLINIFNLRKWTFNEILTGVMGSPCNCFL